MKIRPLILFALTTMCVGTISAQSNDCITMGALAYDDAKAENYDAAYPALLELWEECPEYSLNTYIYLEKAIRKKLENAEDGDKEELIDELSEIWKARLELYPNKTSKGDIYSEEAKLKYKNKIGSKAEQYKAFDKAFNEDRENFTSPVGLYAYFSLLVDLQDAGERSLEDVFEKYDEVIAKVEEEENELAESLASLIEKQESGKTLTTEEKNILKSAETNLEAYSTVKKSINGKLGQRADCDNLIALYNKDFTSNSSEVDWLQKANARLSAKNCTKDPLFFKVSEALHKLEPSARSAYSLGQLAEAEGDRLKALNYYNEAAELETNKADKAKIFYKIANNYRDQGNLGQARTFYKKALSAKPSLGIAYLHIANMYSKSVNDCGSDPFSKRAVYWLAADYAEMAARVDPSLASDANQAAAAYKGLAPQKSEVFQSSYKSGDAIKVGCWIGETVRVPNF
ncbi:hypothetical protein MKO06_02960 [Gramella sp. GC03-9]|uniref:Tetratricopeptide repeat protein n=1 Tax=Christiangramia oceanisediminis TaxID=2920386 RepID=A0A9X2I2W5_9FLAO|nr:hypothetical protein [Gramella oceanisediminis]MCP9198850.1 hypothetical protein [Gramella oceanisediminis]